MNNPQTAERYANFYTDFAFKKLFGTEANKECLISFLNALFSGEEVITDLTYLNTEHLGPVLDSRKAVFDVYCETQSGEKILIEMQKASQDFFRDRSIYYSTFPIQEQAVKGEWDFHLKKVYTIGILNFTFDESSDDYMHHVVKLVDVKTNEVFYDKLTYIYLEMPKFRKGEDELVTIFDKWLYAMKNLCYLMERPAVLQEAVFKRFFEQAEILKFTVAEQREYRDSQKVIWDWYAVTSTAERKGLEKGMAKGLEKGLEEGMAKGLEKGLEEGMAKGLEEGREEKALSIARNLKQMGLPLESIIEATGLSEATISAL